MDKGKSVPAARIARFRICIDARAFLTSDYRSIARPNQPWLSHTATPVILIRSFGREFDPEAPAAEIQWPNLHERLVVAVVKCQMNSAVKPLSAELGRGVLV